MRTGPDEQHETAVEVARRAVDAGAAAISVHSRSAAQGYVGEPNWDVVARVKQAVSMPVIGSGGIRTAGDAIMRLRQSGADGVAIGAVVWATHGFFSKRKPLLRQAENHRPPRRGNVSRQCYNWWKTNFNFSARWCVATAPSNEWLFCPVFAVLCRF